MKELFHESMSANERETILSQHAHTVEDTYYYLPLSEDELISRKDDFFKNADTVNSLENRLKDISATIKDELKLVKGKNVNLLREIRTGQKEVKGKLYHIANFDTSMMETFTAAGELIGSRRLRPDEKQQNVFQIPAATAL